MAEFRLLILGGTTEGRGLAHTVLERFGGRVDVLSSLAGVVDDPVLPPGRVRVGGFGGVDGLRGFLAAERIDAVIDATHPFARHMQENAALACAAPAAQRIHAGKRGGSAMAAAAVNALAAPQRWLSP